MPQLRRPLVTYSVAIAATAVALVVRWLLNPVLDHRLPFITLYGALAFTVWYGGRGPALLVVILGYIATDQLFVETEPNSPLSITGPGGPAGFLLYLSSCAVVIILGHGMRSAQRRAEGAARAALAQQEQLEREVAHHRRTEAALRTKEAELELITSRTPVLLSLCSRDKRFLFVNRAVAEFLGRRPEDIIGRPIIQILGPRAFSIIEPQIERVLAGEIVDFEIEIPYDYPGPRTMRAIYTPDKDERGEVIGWVASVGDVTDRKRVMEALRESERQLATELAAVTRMHEVSTRLVPSGDISLLLDEILAAAIEITDSDMGNIQLLENGKLRIVSHRGFEAPFINYFNAVPEGVAACGTALEVGQRVIVENVTQSEIFAGKPVLEIMRRAQAMAVQSTPLVSRSGLVLGMLSTHYRDPHRPDERELRLLDVLARQAADLIERTQAEMALREADRRKDEFLATLAHELRNPLAPVRNAIQILRLRKQLNPELLWARDVIDRQIQQMTRLIDDLMDVSRITRNMIELRKERVELARVIESAIETSRPLIEAARHELTIDLPPDPIHLHVDTMRLAQVFANLLNNSVKYSEPGSRIVLSAALEDREVVVSLRDRGIGIPADMLPRIFEMFMQVDHSLDRAQGGLGIGLTLVRRLVEMHGGRVEARSAGSGQGSEFIVRLPVVKDEAPAITLPNERESSFAPNGCRVLIADDNQDAAMSLSKLLTILGYDTRAACNGVDALSVAAEFRPHVALLDIGMPGMSGHDVARHLQAEPWGKDILLIAVTGWGQIEDKQRTIEAGFDHHLVKPVDPNALAKLLVTTRPDPAMRV